ncbi:predicted protein [Postia placenta Mad-698-R]|nr:predicted protein [Postia placenta Mad-698-R]
MEVSAGPLSEPSWIAIHRENAPSYTRMGDVCFGTTFSTNLEPDTLGQRIRSALCYLRFVAPLLGATIEKDGCDPVQYWWKYTPVTTVQDPSRQEVQNIGVIMRICDVLDAETSSCILNGLKTVGHTITRLLEAAFILAMFELNPVLGVPAKDAHVTLDLTFIALTKYLVPPYNRPSHITSTSVVVPLIVPFSTFDTQDGPRAKLCCIMDRLQEEYSHYLSNPHLPHLTANIFASKPLRVPPSETWKNPAALMITNVGLIDGRLPLRYSCSDSHAECHIDVEDVAFSNRWSHSARPLVHMWTMRGKVHFQVIGTDVWDETYMREYLRRAVDLVNTFANDR